MKICIISDTHELESEVQIPPCDLLIHFGHIHPAYGTQATKNTLFVNAALLDADGAPSRRPITLNFRT